MNGLEQKYRQLLRLRQLGCAPRAELAALAGRFPGALRELDELPTAEIEARIAQLVSGGSSPELLAIARFHALVLELRAAPRPQRRGQRLSRLALKQLAAELSLDVDAAHRLVFPFARVRRL